MVFNTLNEKKLGEKLLGKLQHINGFIQPDVPCFDSSIQNFLLWNQSAIESRNLLDFDPVCITNGCHILSEPIQKLFELGYDSNYLWKLLYYLLIVYDPFYELDKEEEYEINEFIYNYP